MNRITCVAAALMIAAAATPSTLANVIDFEQLNTFTATTPQGAYFNGNADGQSNEVGWESDGVRFGNSYSTDFGGFWSGWSYSNVQDPETAGFENQYASYPGTGAEGSSVYAVGFDGPSLFVDIPSGYRPTAVDLTNTTYTALSMKLGDAFAKKFGGTSGDDPDFFRVTMVGYTQPAGQGEATGQQEFYLADFRSNDNSLDYIVSDWQTVGLASLGEARSMGFSFASSDTGDFGVNTPSYLALDNLRLLAVPEPPGCLLTAGALSGYLLRRRRPWPSTKTSAKLFQKR